MRIDSVPIFLPRKDCVNHRRVEFLAIEKAAANLAAVERFVTFSNDAAIGGLGLPIDVSVSSQG